jgi:hypothetical protein
MEITWKWRSPSVTQRHPCPPSSSIAAGSRLVPTFLCKIKSLCAISPVWSVPPPEIPARRGLSELRFAIASSSFSEHQIS